MSTRSRGDKVPPSAETTLNGPKRIAAGDLDDRQIRGLKLAEAVTRGKARLAQLDDERCIYWSRKDPSRAYEVLRRLRNVRGTIETEYRCSCADFLKNGRIDCSQIFAERLRRNEVVIDGVVDTRRARRASSDRRPARKQSTADGRSHRTAQRVAREKMPIRVPELVRTLKRAYDREIPKNAAKKDGRRPCEASTRAIVLLLKIANGLSADEMKAVYQRSIMDGVLGLVRPPHQNTLTEWMNSPEVTQVLEWMLETSATPFRLCEVSAIIDSSKVSQLRNAHSRWVEYEGDVRETADWAKCHAIIGVESSVVMGAIFSGSRGAGTHDINHLKPLVEKVQRTFQLEHVLGDKAYLSEEVVGWLFDRGIKAVIPVKKNWDKETKLLHYEACDALVRWYDDRQPDFLETALSN